MRVKISTLFSGLWAFSTLFYAFRGKLGAILITFCIIGSCFYIFRQQAKDRSWASMYMASFLFVFAIVLHALRSLSFEYYLIIGYCAAVLVLLDSKIEHLCTFWNSLKGIAIFEAIGVYLQYLVPNIYYSIISIILPEEVVLSIKTRLLSGYYTGFSREVSFTMFLIVVGLGLFIYDTNENNSGRKWIPIILLIGALFISGKRATQLFFVAALFATQFIKNDNKLKLIKYTAIAAIGAGAIRLSYPWWSKLAAFNRINQLIGYFLTNDIIGMTNGRTVIYEKAIQLWTSNRWFGIGWGNFKYSVPDMLWYSGFDVHNCFLQILCETGIVGLVFYSLFIILSLVNSTHCVLILRHSTNQDDYKLAVFCCYLQLFFILYSLTEPILYEYTDYFIFFVCFNCSNTLLRRARYSKITKKRLQKIDTHLKEFPNGEIISKEFVI